MSREVRDVAALVDRVRPILAGKPSPLIGGVLADLVATWIAGHVMSGDVEKTGRLHANLLEHHTQMVRGLIIIHARMMGAKNE